MLLLVSILVAACNEDKPVHYAIAVHGGAGTMPKELTTPEQREQHRTVLRQALLAGQTILSRGGAAVEAAAAAIVVLEDSPLFNAGRGAVYTNAGTHELDASVMDGQTMEAGAVAGVRRVKNPIRAAVAVYQHSPHVLLAGDGADGFAQRMGLQMVEPSYFDTEKRWLQLERARKDQAIELDHSPERGGLDADADHKFGTVGAVVLDAHGNLSAATSTGGMTNKRDGRVGDSPLIGSGTYANNHTAAVSCTGHGEFFIRYAVAYDVSARMAYGGQSLAQAAQGVVLDTLVKAGGQGGLIAIDRQGNIAMPYNTVGMYRGYVKGGGNPVVSIYAD